MSGACVVPNSLALLARSITLRTHVLASSDRGKMLTARASSSTGAEHPMSDQSHTSCEHGEWACVRWTAHVESGKTLRLCSGHQHVHPLRNRNPPAVLPLHATLPQRTQPIP